MDNTEYNITRYNPNNLIVEIHRNCISRLQFMYSLIIIPIQIAYLLIYSNFTFLSIIFLLLDRDSEAFGFYTVKVCMIVMCADVMLFSIPLYVYSITRHRSILYKQSIDCLLNTLTYIIQCVIEVLCACGIIIIMYFFICTRVWVKWMNIIFIVINLITMIIGLDYTENTQRRLNIIEVFNKSLITDEEYRYGITYYLYCTAYMSASVLILLNYDVLIQNGLIYTEK
ncbi:hypothetical protein NEPAR06_2152 [Nematocida parisii]|uniref:Uncharacterized protein n=1 Tax=Nematocida parisii (strain ERTm3) TaxID=935791 RepID=I3EF79_NEMP3|nr:uncharacterized protein NEPG_02054 [Nematocida parisii ERTm1]EIJ87876.1 hypothetical protein NEQG_01948 [Nematocida parisii ERTm3]KAI5128168.1 hypothetical protein NEPAR08_1083 [Nematocida parisii]EIJ93098.1 hypothetical protein NEPG_02054 [Nematocida parisii ERTm1]KAI5128385.1 hypothetical protein NEPAR03_1294 [Nematocida parisii]KAI5141687.1 hypothetical protein NEPAR04_1159 [Nematocida parisii]|eukprot:XP_013059881.1 hypothetical protein NEPG_02054 [Nematocida parisii ERTm1]